MEPLVLTSSEENNNLFPFNQIRITLRDFFFALDKLFAYIYLFLKKKKKQGKPPIKNGKVLKPLAPPVTS
jgi:hypothetical protein